MGNKTEIKHCCRGLCEINVILFQFYFSFISVLFYVVRAALVRPAFTSRAGFRKARGPILGSPTNKGLPPMNHFRFTARSSYVRDVLVIVILSVSPSVCSTHECFVTNRKNIVPIF